MSTLVEQSRIPPPENIPYGYCHCGCGRKTNVPPRDKGGDRKKGIPRKFYRGHARRRSLEDRYWDKVIKNGPVIRPELGPCWGWNGALNHSGYGELRAALDGYSSYNAGAHRVSWEIHFGEIPNGIWVLHKCDNPSCSNPQHLFLGTHADNMRDAYSKGRMPIGEKHRAAKITEEVVREIRLRFKEPVVNCYVRSYTLIGKEYGLSSTNVKAILLGWTWKHILPPEEKSLNPIDEVHGIV